MCALTVCLQSRADLAFLATHSTPVPAYSLVLPCSKLGVFPTLRRCFGLQPSRSLSRSGTLGSLAAANGDSGTPTSARSQEDINAVLDELERGQQADADR